MAATAAPPVIALVLAGGTGSRAAQGLPKQLVVLGGSTVLEQAVGTFAQHPRIDRIIVVVAADLVDQVSTLLPDVTVVVGGDTRQQSAAAGLAQILDEDALVLIHDAARPFVPAEVIDRCVDALATHDAVGTVLPSADTVYRIRPGQSGDQLAEVPERETVRVAQTPQGFRVALIRKAHRLAAEAGSTVTDDCSAVLLHCPDESIALVAGDERNIKLTTAADFAGVRRGLDERPVT